MEEDSEPQAVGFQAPSGSPQSPKPTLSLLLIWKNFQEELTPQRPGKPSQAAGTRKSASPSHPTSYCHPHPRQQFPQGNMCCGGGSPASPPHHMLGAGAAAPGSPLGLCQHGGTPKPLPPQPQPWQSFLGSRVQGTSPLLCLSLALGRCCTFTSYQALLSGER